jgi:hypothetical protein
MGSWVKKSSAALVVLACSGGTHTGAPAGMSTADTTAGAALYDFDSLDARPVNSAVMAGKPVVLAFITTFDPMSQLQVNELLPLAAEFPDVQFALVALQDAAARELVELYRDTMKVTFPVAMADAATIAGGGMLGDVHHVPTLLVIGRDGRVAWRHAGGVRSGELRSRVKSAAR